MKYNRKLTLCVNGLIIDNDLKKRKMVGGGVAYIILRPRLVLSLMEIILIFLQIGFSSVTSLKI